MGEISRLRVGVDLAKGVFQVHAVREEAGEPVVLRKQLSRAKMQEFLARLPKGSLVGMEACGSAHYWARLARSHGHEVRLMPPAYVKAYVKRNKTDANDAAAICEAAARPTMRFVEVKSEEAQALLMLHRGRVSFVERRTALANQLRASFSEFGIVAATGQRGLAELLTLVAERAEAFVRLPRAAQLWITSLARQWEEVDREIRQMDAAIAAALKSNARATRLLKVPGIGPLGASALEATLADPKIFASGRAFAAWIGLTPREESSGKTTRRGGITKKGDQHLRRLLVLGATAYLARVRRGSLRNASAWVRRMAAHPKRKLAAVALANKLARIVWAMLAKGEDYRATALSEALAPA